MHSFYASRHRERHCSFLFQPLNPFSSLCFHFSSMRILFPLHCEAKWIFSLSGLQFRAPLQRHLVTTSRILSEKSTEAKPIDDATVGRATDEEIESSEPLNLNAPQPTPPPALPLWKKYLSLAKFRLASLVVVSSMAGYLVCSSLFRSNFSYLPRTLFPPTLIATSALSRSPLPLFFLLPSWLDYPSKYFSD